MLSRLLLYPIRGLSPQQVDTAELEPGGIRGDRAHALVLDGQVLTRARFPRLGQLDSQVEAGRLTIRRRGRVVLAAELGSPHGQTVIASFFAAFLAGDSFGHPHLQESSVPPGVSIMGEASLAELARLGLPSDPGELRVNMVVAGMAAGAEQSWRGGLLCLGDAMLRVVGGLERPCWPELMAATHGTRLQGLRAEVVRGGMIGPLPVPLTVMPGLDPGIHADSSGSWERR